MALGGASGDASVNCKPGEGRPSSYDIASEAARLCDSLPDDAVRPAEGWTPPTPDPAGTQHTDGDGHDPARAEALRRSRDLWLLTGIAASVLGAVLLLF